MLANPVAFRRSLLHWYGENRRALPWRETHDPYRIWISEIMLQQTRVAAVLEHYRLFLERFPNVYKLADADEREVLAAWSGLGYYRRARMMRLCAQKIVAEHDGRFPATSQELQTLPGIGRYTAAAIASIAFSEPVSVVDGNVERVLERLSGRVHSKKEFWQRAQFLLDSSRPADFNQSMMELGALVCTPRQPRCDVCPARRWCVTQGEAPRRQAPQRQSRKEIWYTLDERKNHVRLVQRKSDESLMAGMWELPPAPPILPPALSPAPKDPHKRRKAMPAPWRTFRHSITTTNYIVHVTRGPARKNQGRWIALEGISEVPITGLTRKILKAAAII